MKIFVVDDNTDKIRQLMVFLTSECKVDREDIEIARSAYDARTRLKSTFYDLMILDLAIPLRDEDDPHQKVSLELLMDISERQNLVKPGHIIGLTAYDELLNSVTDDFQAYTWTVLHYDPSIDVWKMPIKRSIQYIENKSSNLPSRSYELDVCIVCALQSEMDQILRLSWGWDDGSPLDDNTFVYYGNITSGGRSFRLAAAVPSRMGMMSTALLCSKMIEALRPRFLTMTGICAGLKNKINIGDIILADPSWDWQNGKHVDDELGPHFNISPHQIGVPDFIRVRGQRLKADKIAVAQIKASFNGTTSSTELAFEVAPMASGSAVLADAEIVEGIKRQERNLTGVEMEVYGVYAAAKYAAFPRPTAFAVKSVCDFGDSGKSDEHQRYAAYTSAKGLELFLSRFLHEIIDLAGS